MSIEEFVRSIQLLANVALYKSARGKTLQRGTR